MNAVSIAAKPAPYAPKNKVRFVTATSLFDGHDARIEGARQAPAGHDPGQATRTRDLHRTSALVPSRPA